MSALVASERATVVTIEREGTVDNKPCIDDPHWGFNNDSGNGPHPNVGLNNNNSGFPQDNRAHNHNYVGSQNDENNSLGSNTNSVGVNNGGRGFPVRPNNYVGSQ